MPRRVATLVDWAFAPDWLTVEKAAELTGYTEDFIRWLIQDGGVEVKQQGDTWLIEKASLREYRDALLETLQLQRDLGLESDD